MTTTVRPTDNNTRAAANVLHAPILRRKREALSMYIRQWPTDILLYHQECTLLKSDQRRNPVEFSLRPVSLQEFDAVYKIVLKEVDNKIGYILQESYGTSYHSCPPEECFKIYPSPLATNLVDDINMRRLWIWAEYNVEYYGLHPVDFGVLANLDGSDPRKYSVDKIWYHGQMFDSMDELIVGYNSSK
uniref:Amine oxidase n=1 Tax=Biomphalaria glabrata TaxID=6526 RepID=A0A2C9KRK8_BIOGL